MRSKTILIATCPGDPHAFAVAAALERKGARPILWMTSDFPTRTGETIAFEEGRLALRIGGQEIDPGAGGIATVWNRRPCHAVDPRLLHPADLPFAEKSCETFRQALLELLAPAAFWVNPEAAVRRNSKPLQHASAMAVGLETPETLYTNDPEEIRGFLRRQGGRVVYKPLFASLWKVADEVLGPYANVLAEDMLVEDDLLRAAPGIFQALVPKAWELRLTMMSRRAFAARVLSQETERGRLDWRRAYAELRLEPWEVPADLEARCAALLERLGFVFGCFDFIVTPEGRTVFLEVNQMGQFLFVEEMAGLPLLDAFAEFLLQGRSDFAWSPEAVEVRYADVEAEVAERCARGRGEHAPAPEIAWDETALAGAACRAAS
jgi:glutathione synthase/RimK-type ligase-like ATP-grasp enzyme